MFSWYCFESCPTFSQEDIEMTNLDKKLVRLKSSQIEIPNLSDKNKEIKLIPDLNINELASELKMSNLDTIHVGFSKVYRGEKGATLVTIKTMAARCSLVSTLKESYRAWSTEVGILKKCAGHPNIVQIINVRYFKILAMANLSLPCYVAITMEYCHFDLATLIGSTFSKSLESLQTLANDILSALKFLHARGIAHQAVEPSNILVVADRSHEELMQLPIKILKNKLQLLHFKLSDFGTAERLVGFEKLRLHRAASISAFSPKDLFASDRFSIGATLFYCLLPNEWATLGCDFNYLPMFEDKLSSFKESKLINVIIGLIAKHVKNRISVDEALEILSIDK